MSNGAKQRYRDLIRKGVESTGRDDPQARQAVYDKLRSANEAMLVKKGNAYSPGQSADIRRSLEEAIAEYEGTYSSAMFNVAGRNASAATAADASAHRPEQTRSYLTGALAGIAAVLLLGILLIGTGFLTLSTDRAQAARSETVERELVAAGTQLRDALALLDKVRAEVIKRQQQDPAALTNLAGAKFIGLPAFDPALQRAFPKTLPKGSAVVLRADGAAYKIIVNWPLCPATKLLRPDLVDPVRDVPGLACGGFGIWNSAGAKF
jgi:hypothetical protein